MEDKKTNGRFLAVTLLNALITVFEFVGGILSGSLALLSDAFHNFGDALSVILSYVAHRIGQRLPNSSNTYGYRRIEILTALLNSALLIGVSLFLLIEAIRRFFHPQVVAGGIMFWVALISFLANSLATLLLNRDAKHNLNIRATYLHLLSDALASIGVIISAILIFFFRLYRIDPLMTVIVSIYIAYESWPIIRQTLKILMEGSPILDYDKIKADLLSLPEVTGVHHFHAWQIDENQTVVSLHLNLKDISLSQTEKIYDQVETILKNKYQISHVTIQAECNRGKDEKLFFTEKNTK
ncbi:cation diffusion facilitator family transporter [Liquorilactobacillus sicerae]|uniref:cation diffusion facilitator family transporter n=1 Tax=Liquorilactobacillus sicerae TaxID=1416943 RepID=UPI00248169F1|nr:cation diffusion facilitator family transporter [Liquorilactobacillus sicerae]